VEWDFARPDRTDRALLDAVVDISGNGFHAVCTNSPTRAVTGYNWTGREPNFRHAPGEYGAIHFHDDDLDDGQWPQAFGVDLPDDLESGVYAVRLRGADTESHVPFVVRPGAGSKRNDVALLLPTGSYLAYANDRLQFDTAGTELLIGHTPVVSRHDLELQRHYDFGGSNYEVHSDGSGVLYSSRRRPIITLDPRYRAWMGVNSFWQFPADLCIVDWLDHEEIAFDVITDEDLDREGVELLAPYRVVLTGSHPEYVSLPELDALEAYVEGGGRVMYLGGNGFYWIVSYHPEKPHVMEVRRSEAGTRPHQAPAGEYYLATNGELGALWRNKGRPPQRLLGVGFTAQGFDRSSPYLRMPDSFDERAAFIFAGVGVDEVIGDFGIVGGGAAGAEVDRYDLALGTPPDALLVATSTPLSDNYNHCSEEIFETPPGLRGSEDPDVRSDLVYFCQAGGGAVFSTGSIAWTGSLSHNAYDNNVARITSNVLRRFAAAEALDW
jgi:N,N-dimethylformamidase